MTQPTTSMGIGTTPTTPQAFAMNILTSEHAIEALEECVSRGWISDAEAKTFVNNTIQAANNWLADPNQGRSSRS